jgi:hypothetical protein
MRAEKSRRVEKKSPMTQLRQLAAEVAFLV